MRAVVFGLAVLATASAIPRNTGDIHKGPLLQASNSQRDDGLTSIVRDFLETFREIMVNGSDNIPVLDPLDHEGLDLDLSILGLHGSYLNVRDIYAKGLASFETPNLDLRISSLFPMRFTLTMDIELPAIEAKADSYDLNLDILGFNLYGKGSISIAATRPRATIIAVLSANLSDNISLSIFDLTLVIGIDTFEPQITGLFNDNDASIFISSALKSFVPAALEMFENEVLNRKEDITEFISPLLKELLNDILQDLDLGDLISPGISDIKVHPDTSRLAY